MLVAHRARIALDDICSFDEYVLHELLVLRTLLRAGNAMTGRQVARAQGWAPGRASEVLAALRAKAHVAIARYPGHRCRAMKLTDAGAAEAMSAGEVVDTVGRELMAVLDEHEMAAFVSALRKVAERSERLWRHRSVESTTSNACES
jgi:DNA-binding MarR family transcriptional regulator